MELRQHFDHLLTELSQPGVVPRCSFFHLQVFNIHEVTLSLSWTEIALILRTVTHLPKDGHPPERVLYKLGIWYLVLSDKTNTR